MSANPITETIRIVEYDPSLAGAVADMWNRSNESWGGGSIRRTEDTVRREMETTSNLHVFLAVDGGEVVGFCSFAHYRHDEGALYVPLLNVRPDYHGRKVGRNLILHAVRKTVEMGWPRLDLFTWAGNTKAVPMYKKCGFFWERNEDYVHLMNFIPSVLQTEALAPYLSELDWYSDSTRELPIEPDGRRERGFDFLDYSWQKGDLSVRAEFEKSGRGLTALDTPDYEIRTELDNHGLVFGGTYPVRYIIRNRSASDLDIAIRGEDDKNIAFSLSDDHKVKPGETFTVEGTFTLGPVIEEQNDKKTHPAVKSSWKIGGRAAEFRIGVAPKFPVKLSIALPDNELYPGVPSELYLNAENQFNEETAFSFVLPEADFLDWEERSVRFTVPAKGKLSVRLPFTLKRYGLYSDRVEVTAVPDGKEAVSFESRLSVLLKGTEGRYGGQAGDQWVAVNGGYSLHLNSSDNGMWVEYPGSSHNFWWAFPRLGKPFSEEMSKKRASEVQIYGEGEWQVLTALYESDDFPGLTLKTISKLSAGGIVEFRHEIGNSGDSVSVEDVHVMANFTFFGKHLILPYQNRFMDMGDGYAGDPMHWDSGQVTENWLFSGEDKASYGICWDPSIQLRRPEYTLGLEQNAGVIAPGETVQTKPVTFALNAFRDWKEFRAFARKQRNGVLPEPESHLQLVLGGGNPFARGELQAELNERKQIPLDGSLELYVQEGAGVERVVAEMKLDGEQDRRSAAFEISGAGTAGAEAEQLQPSAPNGLARRVRVVYRGSDRLQERSGVWFPQTEDRIVSRTEEGPAGTVYTVSNGVLELASAPGFGNVIHSLKYQGEEWLDSSYPVPAPRSWWNPWCGGLGVSIPGLGGFTRQQEPRSVSRTKRTDAHGNVWEGLRLTVSIEKQDMHKGLAVNHEYLMLPGIPVVCMLHSVTNGTGLTLPRYSLTADGYFKTADVFEDGWIEYVKEGRFFQGQTEADLPTAGHLRLGASTRKNTLYAVSDSSADDAWAYVNNQIVSSGNKKGFPLLCGETFTMKPSFLVFGELKLQPRDMQALLNLTFAPETSREESENANH